MPKKSSCKKGEIFRVGYTRHRGSKEINVKGKCIPAVSQSGKKRSSIDQKEIKKRHSIQKQAREKFGVPNCPPDQIVREGYFKKSHSRKSFERASGTKVHGSRVKGAWVPPTCVQDTGLEGKGTQLFVLEKGTLSHYGYSNIKLLNQKERHIALSRALNDIKPLSLFKKLNALYVLNQNKDPEFAEILKKDRDWIKTTPKYSSRQTSKKKSKNN